MINSSLNFKYESSNHNLFVREILITVVIFILALNLHGQTTIKGDTLNQTKLMISEDEVFTGTVVEEMPEPKSGLQVFQKKISNELNIPVSIITKTTIISRLEIDTLGNISEIKVINNKDSLVEEEIIRTLNVVNEKFIPAKQRGKPVCIYIYIPITFDPTK